MSTYVVSLRCGNCGVRFKKEFPHAFPVPTVDKCDHCGCISAVKESRW